MYVVLGPDGRQTPPVDLATLQAWVGRGQLPAHAVIIKPDGNRIVAGSMDELVGLYAVVPPTRSAPVSDGTMGGLIPYHNPKALTAYYLGYGALFPCIGLFFAPFVIVMARKGLQAYEENPAVRGKGHAITAIIFASLGGLYNLAIWVAVLISLANRPQV